MKGYITKEQLSDSLKNELSDFSSQLEHIKKYGVKTSLFGSKGDGVTDDTQAIQEAIDFARDNNINKVMIPKGNYIITDSLVLYRNIHLIGVSKYETIIDTNIDLTSKPLITTYGDENNVVGHSNIKIENLSIKSRGNRTKYTVEILNCHGFVCDNVYIEQLGQSDSISKHGLYVSKAYNYQGATFVTKITNSRFSRCACEISSTDSYFDKNEFWGNDVEFALHLKGCSSSMITNNEFVGGNMFGALYISTATEGLKIIGNYFDGSYANINTQWGIYSQASLKHTTITGNNFWKQKNGGIYLNSSESVIISSNNFEECDMYQNGSPDIYMKPNQTHNSNVISNNTFFREKCYNDNLELVSRSSDKIQPVMSLYNKVGFPATIITGNTLSWYNYYKPMEYNEDGQFKSYGNSSKYFNIDSNTHIDKTTSSKGDIVYNSEIEKQKNLFLEKFFVKDGYGNSIRIDNINSVTATDLNNNNQSFDFNKVYNKEYKVFINDKNVVLNLPSFVNTPSIVKFEYVADNYGVQEVTTYTSNDSNSTLGIKAFRFLQGGEWLNWIIQYNSVYSSDIAPSYAPKGFIWYDTKTNENKCFNGSSWDVI